MENIEQIYYFIRYADQVCVGDEVLVQKNDNLFPAKVINVSSLVMQGDCRFVEFFYIFLSNSEYLSILQGIKFNPI